MFSLAAPSPPPVHHLPPPGGVRALPGRRARRTAPWRCEFLDAAGEEVARNAQPVNVQPGKFGRLLVKGELNYEDYGTIEAHVRLVGGPTVVVPLTLLPPRRDDRAGRFAAGLSQHPDPAVAVGEVVGQVLEALGDPDEPPDLAMLFVTPPHAAAIEDDRRQAISATLRPRALLGCAAVSVVGGEPGGGAGARRSPCGPARPAR